MSDDGGNDNTCVKNPTRKYSDHCYHDTDDGKHTRCCWCKITHLIGVPQDARRHGPHLPKWLAGRNIRPKR